MVIIEQPKVALQHPFWGGVSPLSAGASGTSCSGFRIPEGILWRAAALVSDRGG